MSGDILNVNEIICQENSNAYKESNWGKKVDGEYIIDGYKYKGRQAFKSTREKLEYLLQRGKQSEINGVSYTVLDTRIKGVELEVEIGISESKKAPDSRGVAMVKLYGPNKRKENTVTVTKSKESDIKFVKILALKIIKPLIDNILSTESTEVIAGDKRSNQGFKCKICDKSFVSEPGMKGHMTKMHKEDGEKMKDIINLDNETEFEDVDKVIHDIKEEKKYSSKCSQCEIHFEASMKYGLIQHILEHKEDCKPREEVHKTCSDCKYEAKNILSLKRHMRDKHDILSVSTSPPPKKHKISNCESSNNDEEAMDVDDKNNTKEYELVHSEVLIQKAEESVRSKLMDKKVIAKNKKIDEEETIFKEKQNSKIIEKKKIEEIAKEKDKMLNKQRKQKSKDARKRINRKKLQMKTVKN